MKLKTLLFTITGWVLVIVLVEFAFGFIAKDQHVHMAMVDRQSARTTLGYFSPNQSRTLLFPGLKPYKATINSLGLRVVSESDLLSAGKIQKRKKILCLGDSFTFGLFVSDQDSYPYRLQSALGKDYAVLNAGIGEATISDYLYYLKLKGPQMNPDLVVINYFENDLFELDREEPLYEKIIRENKFSIFKTVKLSNFLRSFRKWEVAYKYHRNMLHMEDPNVRDILLEESKVLEDLFYVENYYWGDPIMRPHQEKLKVRWEKYFNLLGSISDYLKTKKIPLIFVINPNILTLWEKNTKGNSHQILYDFLLENNIPWIDLQFAFGEKRENFLELYNNPPRDFHLSGKGNQIVADLLNKKINSIFNEPGWRNWQTHGIQNPAEATP